MLDEAVWSAVKDALLNPKHLTARIVEGRQVLARAVAAKTRDNDRTNLIKEEARLFQDYRKGVLSPAEFVARLETVKSEQHSSVQSPVPEGNAAQSEIDRPLAETCRQFAKYLDDPRFEIQQTILRRLVDEIFIETHKATINGKICNDPADAFTIDSNQSVSAIDPSLSQ